MKRALASFTYGAVAPIRCFKTILTHPRLIFWSALPTLLALLLYGLLIQKIRALIHRVVVAEFARWGWDSTGWAAWGATSSIELILIFAAALLFSLVVGLMSIPLLDFLAEASESCVTPPLPPAPSSSWGHRIRLITLDGVKNILNLFLGLFFFGLGWIPGLQFVAWIFGAWLICLQFVSYPQTRRGHGILKSMRFLLSHPFASLGFGGVAAMMLAIPWVSCFFLPLLVVSGTQLFSRAVQSESLDGARKLC